MKAIALDYATQTVGEREVPQPLRERSDQVLFAPKEIGICGTDRDLATFRRPFPPHSDGYMVIGHECLGQVREVGDTVQNLRPGDWVVPIVRRPCQPMCRWCARRRRDLCESGHYTERGIMHAHGYFTELAVDAECDLIPIPQTQKDHAVLVEPLSVVEKAISTAFRLHPGLPESALVLGAGTIGLLAAMALKARGMSVTICSIEPLNSQRAGLAGAIGAGYVNDVHERYDFVLEAAGSRAAWPTALRGLHSCGILVVLGIISPVELPLLQTVVHNQVIVGSVNSAPHDFRAAVKDLALFTPAVLSSMVEREPMSAFQKTLTGPLRSAPKIVHVLP